MRLLALAFLLVGCVHPDYIKVDDVSLKDKMMMCREMCGKRNVKSFTPYTGECTCATRRR